METMKTDNELIAEFMGFTFDGKVWTAWRSETSFECNHPFVVSRDGNTEYNVLLFDTSWDWLMPVVEKIEGLGFRSSICFSTAGYIHGTNFYATQFDTGNITGKSKIETTYKAVIEFVKWYNQQSPNS